VRALPFAAPPLLKRELIGLLRTRRAFWALVLAVGLSCAIPLLAWPEQEGMGDFWIGMVVFSTFAMTQLTVGILIIPAFTAGAISGERERGTYDLLYSSLLTPAFIVVSKALAPAGYVIILLAACAPAVCLLYLLGGFTFDVILKVYCITFAAVVSSGIVCLTVSQRSRSTAQSAVRGMFWVVFYNGGLLFMVMLLIGLAHKVFDTSPGEGLKLLLAVSPYPALSFELWGGWPQITGATHYLLYAAGISAAHLAYLLARARTAGLVPGGERANKARRRRSPKRGGLALLLVEKGGGGWPLLSNPVFQKEVRTAFHGRPWFRRTVFWGALALFGALAFLPEDSAGRSLAAGSVALTLIVLLAPGLAATALPRELEQGNLDLLRGTLLTLRQVFAGKLLASLFGAGGLVAAAAIVIGFASCTEPPDERYGGPLEWMAKIWLVGGAALAATWTFTTVLAASIATFVRRSLAALLGAYALVFGWFLVLPVALSLFGQGEEVERLLELVNPWVFLDAHLSWPYGSRSASDSFLGEVASFLGVNAAAALILWLIAIKNLERRWARER
jgi:ABC-type transport system involved in multi-copper enzyme maturation permease subunit